MSKGIILLEGPDASGKTTLARTLVRDYDAVHIHAKLKFKNRMFAYHTALLRKAVELSNDRLVVMDRLWPSELVYGSVYRGLQPWTYPWQMFDRVLRKHAAVYVLCLTEDQEKAVARHRANKDPNHPYDDSGFRRVWQGYRQMADRFSNRIDWLMYSIETAGKDVPYFCQLLMEHLQHYRDAQFPLLLDHKFHNGVGHINGARILLVGEEVNQKWRNISWPFYENGNSSKFVNDALRQALIPESDIMMTNALGEGARLLVEECSFRKILPIALGGVAQRTLQSWGVSHAGMKHPQHARRFGHDLTGYSSKLREVYDTACKFKLA